MSHALPASCHDINASVVQGSGFGPTAFNVNASDLQMLDQSNKLAKYAGDTYLIVGASRRSTIVAELNHISTWAARNNLRLNANKSREMLIWRSSSFELPPTIAGVERVTSMKILGVIVNDNLRATDHVAELCH